MAKAGLSKFNKICFIICYVAMIFAFIYQVVVSIVILFLPRRLFIRRKDITGQIILITGAGSGLGRQLGVEFSKHGTRLIIVDNNGQSLLHTKKLLDGRLTVFTYECDVSDYKNVCEIAEKVKRDVGDVDILVNNAGIVSGQYLIDLSEDEIVRTMKVNTLAHFWTVKAFLPAMMQRNSGHVVSIAAGCRKIACPKMADYCSNKFAAVGFVETLEIELREQKLKGIKVTIVCTAHIDTGLFDGFNLSLGTTMTPEYVAKEVVFGVLEEQELIYIPYFLKFLIMLKECFPRWLLIKGAEFTGDIKVMENFTGRKMKNLHKREEAD